MNNSNPNKIIVINGPTGSGKSDFAIKLATIITHYKTAIINADSKQVYKELPILTAQPSINDYKIIPHLLYGYISVTENYNLSQWINDTTKNIKTLHLQGYLPILVGGSNLYIDSIINGLSPIPNISIEFTNYIRNKCKKLSIETIRTWLNKIDPITYSRIDTNNTFRMIRAIEVYEATGKPIHTWQNHRKPNFNPEIFKIFTILPERQKLYNNINKRLFTMIEQGLINEIYNVKPYINNNLPSYKIHGLPIFMQYLNKQATIKEAINKTQQDTRNYAKRQITWYKNKKQNNYIIHQTNNYTIHSVKIIIENDKKTNKII